MVVPNISEPSVWDLLHVTLVVPRFLDKMRTAALSNAYYLNIYLKNGHYSFIQVCDVM